MKVFLVLAIFFFTGESILDRVFYNQLDVPICAGPDEIKQSFRKLSRKYHPDRNPNSIKRFQKINVAYETLSNANRKYLYDRLGSQKMDDPNIQQEKNIAALKGSNFTLPLFLTLQDIYIGKSITGTIFKRIACPHCLGSGAQNQHDMVRCPECNGQGRKTRQVPVGNGYYNMMTQPCTRCSGRGKIIGKKCLTCDGKRIISGAEDFIVKIPAGVFDGQTLNFVNMGDEIEQGAPGDLIVKVTQTPDKRFIRDVNDLRTEIEISLRQALFGFKRSIKQLDGRELDIEQTQITQPGQYLTIQGEGFQIRDSDQKGNLIVKVNVAIPEFSQNNLSKLQNLFDRIHPQ